CGNCGTQQRYCNGCDWTGSYQCINQGSCSPGQTQNLGACGNCGTLQQTCQGNCQWGGSSCVNQGPCSPGSTQCVGSTFQSCTSGCQWQNSGTNADGDAKDKQCGDSLCDNAAGVYDSTKTATETNCNDGLDNDCDGLTDCSDNDCDGSITGTVKNHDSQLISSADVSAKKDLTTIKSSATNQQGSYLISPISCGAYNLVASHPDYAPQTKTNVVVNPLQQTTANFEGGSSLVFGSSCEADCTFASDSIIHASCDNKNGCTFYDSISKAACDNSQPGWVRDYDASHYVTCASGSPQPKVEIEASVSCSSGTLVKVTRIVVYNGKPVKLVVAACG
ncbi:carboxypeptidase regulatory-like domain-containing protein, partial [Candidatus Woesearchaeota archaeon]|nr:carboxypeptidase regulatory-like domain-containing protein [Candidatus Woesearchaeota archaeon]